MVVVELVEFLNSEFVPNFYPDPGGLDRWCLSAGWGTTNSDQFTATLRVFQRLQGSLVTIFSQSSSSGTKFWPPQEAKNGKSCQK